MASNVSLPMVVGIKVSTVESDVESSACPRLTGVRLMPYWFQGFSVTKGNLNEL